MKYLLMLLGVGAVYLVLIRSSPVAPVVKTITEPPMTVRADTNNAAGNALGSNLFKRPLDRTNEVLQQARARVDDPAMP